MLVVSLTALCNPALYNTQPLEVIDASYTDLVPLVKLCAARGALADPLLDLRGVRPARRSTATGRPTRAMNEDETALFLGPVAARALELRARQAAARAGDLGPRRARAGSTFTIVRPFNVIGPRMDFMPGVDGEGIPRVLASSCTRSARRSRCRWSTADGSGARSSTWASSWTPSCACSSAPRRARARSSTSATRATTSASASSAGRWRDAYRALRAGRAGAARCETVTAEAFYGAGLRRLRGAHPRHRQGARACSAGEPRARLEEMLPGIVADYLARYEGRCGRAGARGRGAAGGARVKLAVVVPAYNAGPPPAAAWSQRILAASPAGPRADRRRRRRQRATTPASVARALAATTPELLLVRRPRNGGYGAAMKDGLAAAASGRRRARGQRSRRRPVQPRGAGAQLAARARRARARSAAGLAHRRRAGARRAACPSTRSPATGLLNQLERRVLRRCR